MPVKENDLNKKNKNFILLVFFILFLLHIFNLTCQDSLLGAVPRFGVDEQNSRQIQDPLQNTGFPFKKAWTCELGGLVESQPILIHDSIYIQAGQRLSKISLTGELLAQSPILSQSELASGSSPSYVWTAYGARIYQATRDHRLWALDPDNLQPVWQVGDDQLPYISLSAGSQPDKRYRITSSPLVLNQAGSSWLFLGTANGDGTNKSGQYADNGFFVLEDLGNNVVIKFKQQMLGEVTGSPIRFGNQVIATQNQVTNPSQIILFDLNKLEIKENTPIADYGIPGSPAAEGDRVYLADRNSQIYCYSKDAQANLLKLWSNPSITDVDRDRLADSYNLKSPVIGNKFIYLPIQKYKNTNFGAVIAVDKETGQTKLVKKFASPICSNLIYWQPTGNPELEYLLTFLADGMALLLDAKTLEPVYGFMDEAGRHYKQVKLLPHLGEGASPEPIIAENLMLLVDGQGILHAFEGQGPVNFICTGKAENLKINLQIHNQSRMDYKGIPLVVRGYSEKSEKFTAEYWRKDLIIETEIDLKAGEIKNIQFILPKDEEGKTILAEINPIGHPQEKLEEIYPRQDNRFIFQLEDKNKDLEVISIDGPSIGTLGKLESIKALIHNKSELTLNQVLIEWYQDGQLLRQERQDFLPNEKKQLTWLWQSPKKAGLVQLKVWVDPQAEIKETDRLNNQKDQYISFDANFGPPSCDATLENKSWPVVYSRIIGYQQRQRQDCWVGYYGQLICQTVYWTDYSSPIWEWVTVNYTESINVKTQVDTGQGIITDPKHPKLTDRDSRGSWAIRPYARIKNLNPNEITRAGYGFNLKVTTQYNTDWQRKVPIGLAGTAQPIAANYGGPTMVVAAFYDTRGTKVCEKQLERTGGTSGVGEAIWQLPKVKHIYSDGTTAEQRKHYTAIDIPDGDYIIIVKVEDAGKNKLHTCKTARVKIYGSMFDDQYTSFAQ